VLLQAPIISSDEEEDAKPCLILALPYSYTALSPSSTNTDDAKSYNAMISYTPVPTPSYPSLFLPDGTSVPDASRGIVSLSVTDIQKYTRHVFEARFIPLKLVVNGRKGRRVVVVLGSDKKHYKVLDLDFAEKGEEKGNEGGTDDSIEGEADGDADVEMLDD
jgi:anaphase-promoting complex subunit 4